MIPIPSNAAYFGLLASNASGAINDAFTVALTQLLNKGIAIKMAGAGDGFDFAAIDKMLQKLESDYVTFHTVPMFHINIRNRTLNEIVNNAIHPNDQRANYQIQPDDYYRYWAKGLKSYGKPLLLRVFSEMNWNGPETPGGVTYRTGVGCKDADTGAAQTPALLIKAWQHIHDIFVGEGATNVQFMWIQIPYYSGRFATTPYDALYPGDAYVDWVGWDVYNFGKGGYLSFSALVDADYVKMQSIAPGKPMILPEFNTVPGSPGQRAAWYSDMLISLPTRYPKISAISFFNVVTGNLKLIEEEPDAVAAFREKIASSYFLSSVGNSA